MHAARLTPAKLRRRVAGQWMLTARPAADHAWHVGGVTGIVSEKLTYLPSYLAMLCTVCVFHTVRVFHAYTYGTYRTRTVRTIRVRYDFLYHTLMVIPYTYMFCIA